MKYLKLFNTKQDYLDYAAHNSLKYTVSCQADQELMRLYAEHDTIDKKILNLANKGVTYQQASDALINTILEIPIPEEWKIDLDFNEDGIINIADQTYITDRKYMFYHKYHTVDNVLTNNGDGTYTVDFNYVSKFYDDSIEVDLPAPTSTYVDINETTYYATFNTDLAELGLDYKINPQDVVEIKCNGKTLTIDDIRTTSTNTTYLYGDGQSDEAIRLMITYSTRGTYRLRIYDFEGAETGKDIESLSVKFRYNA